MPLPTTVFDTLILSKGSLFVNSVASQRITSLHRLCNTPQHLMQLLVENIFSDAHTDLAQPLLYTLATKKIQMKEETKCQQLVYKFDNF